MSALAEIELRCRTLDRVVVKPAFVAAVFFVSGFPALIYQITWQRSLFALYGINVEAVTVVIAGFLFGLGIGSLAGGRLSCNPRWPLLALFGTIELSIGLFGMVSLRLFELVGAQTLFLPIAGTTAAVLGLLFMPTLLMGSTLPILTAYLVTRAKNVGNSVGLLYCVNTLGSAIACFACAFGLARLLGMQGMVNLAAAINIMIGAAALAEAWRTRERNALPAAAAEAGVARAGAGTWLGPAIVLAGLIGFLSLSYEILWFRAFALANNTAGAFAVVLGTYLAGIANGSLRARRLFAQPLSGERAARLIAVAVFAGSVLGLFLLPLTRLSVFSGFGYFYPMLLMVFVQGTLFGGLFPVVCHWGIAADPSAGSRLSQVYLGNILGSVGGTLLTGFVLMDRLSLGGIALLLAEAGIVAAAALSVYAGTGFRQRLAFPAGALAAGLLLLLPSGLFAQVYEGLTYKTAPAPGEEFTDVVENKSGVVAVNRKSVVYGGGAYDGMIELDMLADHNLLIRPYSLSLYHPDPQEVLMIGLATGAWAQVVANHPSVKRLTIVEINPGYLPIIKRHPEVAGLLRNRKVEIVIDDGRRWLNRHPEARFDAIVQNTTWNYRPNVTNLLSAEYLRLVAGHLKAGGIALYNTTGSLRAQRTACEAFADGYRELNVMVVGQDRLRLDHERLAAVLADYQIDGRAVFDAADPRYRGRRDEVLQLLDRRRQPGAAQDAIIEPCASILARSRDLAPITDDNMGEEWGFIDSDPMLARIQHALGL
jgi:spermidine synthase